MPGLLWWEYVGSSRRMKELIPLTAPTLSWTKFNRKPLEGVLQAAPQIVQELSDAQLQIKSVHQCCQACIQAPAGQKLLNTIFKTSLPHNFSVIFELSLKSVLYMFIFYKKMWHPFVHLSIRPFIYFCLSEARWEQQPRQTTLSPATSFILFWGIHRHSQASREIISLQCVLACSRALISPPSSYV